MSIRWDKRNKRFRFEFDRYIQSKRHRISRLLPRGWSQAQADAYDRAETARLYAIAVGIAARDEPLIDHAVALYLQDKRELKSFKSAAEHLGAIAWAYAGKPISSLPEVSRAVLDNPTGARGRRVAPATLKNRLAVLKAACRWAWKRHGLTDSDPTARMQLPAVRNERHVYLTREGMLKACRACHNWAAQIAIRVAFYTGFRLGELWRVRVEGRALVLDDSKNGDRRTVPAHPRIAHLLCRLPLQGNKRTVQMAWTRARDAVGLGDVKFHDLRHSAASEMVNAGVPLYTVGAVLGHRDARSTKRYAHLRSETLADAVSMIGKRRA